MLQGTPRDTPKEFLYGPPHDISIRVGGKTHSITEYWSRKVKMGLTTSSGEYREAGRGRESLSVERNMAMTSNRRTQGLGEPMVCVFGAWDIVVVT